VPSIPGEVRLPAQDGSQVFSVDPAHVCRLKTAPVVCGPDRREELDQMRWRLEIVISEGVYGDPLRTLERVRDALLEDWHLPDLQARVETALSSPPTRAI
jgi:hypothetical protein